jgi:hypothetical protein
MAAMPGSRSTPPLFELIRQAAPPAPPRAIPKPEAPVPVAPSPPPKVAAPIPAPAPRPAAQAATAAPDSSPPVTGEPRRPPEGSTGWRAASLRDAPQRVRTFLGPARAINLPLPYVLLAGAAVAFLFVMGWSIAYFAGQKAGEAKWNGEIGTHAPAGVSDPLQTGGTIAVNPDLMKGSAGDSPRATPPTDKTKAASRSPSRTGETGTVATVPAMPVGSDPRVSGMNYLVLGSHLERSLAERAVAFLAENGVQAMMVPEIDKGAKAPNNAGPVRYRLLSTLALPGDQTKAAAANKHKAEIARLGKVFKQDHKGQMDFAGAFWEKYEH